MDLLAAYRVVAAIAERGSVTAAAASLALPQSVASRRISALEQHLGTRLFDRTGRELVLTQAGRTLLPAVERLVRLAVEIELDADRVGMLVEPFLVPDVGGIRDLAVLQAAMRAAGLPVDVEAVSPQARAERIHEGNARVALIASPASRARWRVPLGVATRREPTSRAATMSMFRRRRDARRPPRIHLQPEDNVPHIRDEVQRAALAMGLAPSQIVLAPTRAVAVAAVIANDDVTLCSRTEAIASGLFWQSLRDLELARGYAVGYSRASDALLLEQVADDIAAFIGAAVADTKGDA